jgi:hypothetical protein
MDDVAVTPDPSPEEIVRFETRIVVILRDDLAGWQRANATAFLVSGIAAHDPATVGEPYEDASGNRYLPMFREPVYVYQADAAELFRAAGRARSREIPFALFTDALFTTGHDAANRAAVRSIAADDLSFVGIAFRTDRKAADKVTKGLRFHP